jgi:hypothetical protein
MTEPTYTNRQIESYTVKANDGNSISTEQGTGFAIEPEVAAQLPVGTDFYMETTNISRIVGIRTHGRWLKRLSDQDIEREHAAWKEKWEQDKRDQLAANILEYTAQEAALPEWVRCRIEYFHEKGGENFLLNGWGYELVVARLAVAYFASGGVDDDEVNRISHEEGTSGNQHDVARMLAQIHGQGNTLAGTIAALTPLTGDPFYEGSD